MTALFAALFLAIVSSTFVQEQVATPPWEDEGHRLTCDRLYGAPLCAGDPGDGTVDPAVCNDDLHDGILRCTQRGAPPSLAEALAVCPAPVAPAIHHDPYVEGVTGLMTYLWTDEVGSQRTVGQVRGHDVTCALAPTRYDWDTGDGHVYTTDRAGAAHPGEAVAHMYEVKGRYTLTLTVAWTRSTNVGDAALTTTTTKPYQVVEIRSRLTAPPD